MDDEAAFVAAIAAAPGDEHLPLVFADWLDDRGDPRGQWLRDYYVRPWLPPTYANPIPKLLESLANNKKVTDVRRCAAVIGAPMVPGLVELLKHQKPRVRYQACMCLRAIGKPAKDAVPALLDAMGDPDAGVRYDAAKALQDIGARDATDTAKLKAALTDENWNVRRAASKVLGSMRAKGSVLDEVVERLSSPDAGDRKEVIEGLVQLDTADTVPHLVRQLDDADAEVRAKAIEALGGMKHAGVVPALCRAMASDDTDMRALAAMQFVGYRWNTSLTRDAVAALAARLDDEVAHVRAAACLALEKAGELAPSIVPKIIALLEDASAEVQVNAIRTLRTIAKGDKAALAALVSHLANPDPAHRAAAVEAVGLVGRGDPVAVAALVPLLADPDEEVANGATSMISDSRPLSAALAPPLLARLARVRAATQWRYGGQQGYAVGGVFVALGRIEAPPAEVIDTLREVVRNPPEEGNLQQTAIEALAALGPAAAAAVPDLAALFSRDGRHWNERSAATVALVRIGGRGFDELAAILDGGSDETRAHIILALRRTGAAALPLLPALLRVYHRATDDWRRNQAVEAIRQLGTGAAAAIPDLLTALEAGGSIQARAGAICALEGFGPALVPHLPRLVELMRRPEFADVRCTFACVLAPLAPHEAAVRDPLRELLRAAAAPVDPNDWSARSDAKYTRQTCAAALLTFKDEALLPDLAPLVTDLEVEIRRAIVYQLARLETPAANPLFRQALADTDDTVRLRAIETLTNRGDDSDETATALAQAVEDRAPKVRRAAIDALNKLNAGTPAALAALAAAIDDADTKVAERARIALKKLTPKAPKGKKKPK